MNERGKIPIVRDQGVGVDGYCAGGLDSPISRRHAIPRRAQYSRALRLACGSMTPTLKLKRNNLAAHFAQEIEQVYKG